MGSLPVTGQWMRLEVPAAAVGLENVAVKELAFVLYGRRAWWDKAGVANNMKYYSFNGKRIAMKKGGVLTYLHSDHLGSTVLETVGNSATADQKYYAYGKQRDTGPVVTDHKFTGQKLDGTGLQYYNARYYDPQIGAFISPDPIVPDPSLVIDYNRYVYARGNTLKYNDPSGHCPICLIPIFAGVALMLSADSALPPDEAATTQAGGQLGAAVVAGDANDVVTVLTAYDYIANEPVPYFSSQWYKTVALAALPFALGSALRMVNKVSDAVRVSDEIVFASRFFDDYTPGPNTGFSGVFDPATNSMLVRPSGNTLLSDGTVPLGRVGQAGGHGVLNRELAQAANVDSTNTLGFVLIYEVENTVSIRWNSGSVNIPNYDVRAVPAQYRQQIIDAIQQATGYQVIAQ